MYVQKFKKKENKIFFCRNQQLMLLNYVIQIRKHFIKNGFGGFFVIYHILILYLKILSFLLSN